MAQGDAFRIAAMFTTDAHFQVRALGTAVSHSNLHQASNTLGIN